MFSSPALLRRRGRPGARGLCAVVVVAAVCAGMAGCGGTGTPTVTSAAPPTVICGTVLSNSAAGPVVYNATRHLPTIKYQTVAGVLMFRVARGCDTGARVTWVPSSAAVLEQAAYARDGQMVAVVLLPSRPHAAFRLIATQNGQTVASATVNLA